MLGMKTPPYGECGTLHTQLYFTTHVVAKKTLNIIIKHNLNRLNKRSFN